MKLIIKVYGAVCPKNMFSQLRYSMGMYTYYTFSIGALLSDSKLRVGKRPKSLKMRVQNL